MPSTFESQTFANAKAMTAELELRKRRIHQRFGVGRCSPDTDGDAMWLWKLIGMHRRGDDKITPRVKGFAVKPIAGFARGTLHIVLLDANGTELVDRTKTDKPAMVGKNGLVEYHFQRNPDGHRQESLRAFRDLVDDQVLATRTEAQKAGKHTTGCHVGHGFQDTDPFGALVVRFLMQQGMPGLAAVKIERVAAESGRFKLVDTSLAAAFREYHAQHSRMEMQGATANLKNNYQDKLKMRIAEKEAAAAAPPTLTDEQRASRKRARPEE